MLTANVKADEGGTVRDMALDRMGKGKEVLKDEGKMRTFYPVQDQVGGALQSGLMWICAAMFALHYVCTLVRLPRLFLVVQVTSATQAASLLGATLPALPLSSLITAPPVTV